MNSRTSNYVVKIRRKGRTKWAISYVDLDGRRHKEMTAAYTKEAAKALLRQKVDEILRQKALGIVPQPQITYEEFAKKYLLHQKSAVEPSTYDRCRAIVDQTTPIFGDKRLGEIHLRDIQDYVNARAQTVYTRQDGTQKKIAPGTVKRELIMLSGLFTKAVDWEYIVKNPCRKVVLRKYESRKQRILTFEEQDRLFKAFQLNDRRLYLADVVTVALYTGMREGEILGLLWADIDFTAKKITVRSTNENPTKGKRTRALKMSSHVASMLARLYMQALKKAGGNAAAIQNRFVFTNPRTGTRYVDTKLAWYASLRDARIVGLRFHDLRHTFATRAIQANSKLPGLQQVLGHADITTTMRYVHMLGADLEAVIDSVEDFEKKERDDEQGQEARIG